MKPSPIGSLPLGTLITTRADEDTISEALDLYKSLLTDKSFFGRGGNLGPILAITDDDSAERNGLNDAWPEAKLLLCHFHHLQAVWSWLWKAEHKIKYKDFLNLLKNTVYAETTEEFIRSIANLKMD